LGNFWYRITWKNSSEAFARWRNKPRDEDLYRRFHRSFVI
jgi:hypothetical protein